jgi:hypothetical protein
VHDMVIGQVPFERDQGCDNVKRGGSIGSVDTSINRQGCLA